MNKETIKLGALEIKFLHESADTQGAMSVFEFMVPPGARVPLPHYHEAFDEAAYVLEGTLTFTIEGVVQELSAGQSVFVQRGRVHGFNNLHDVPVRALSVVTPALIGPEYFIELAEIVNAGGPPDPAKMNAVLKKHGLVPVAPQPA